MAYYAFFSDGTKYGPAEIALLQKWVDEKRINGNTILEDAVTGKTGRASLLPGLEFPVVPPPVVELPPNVAATPPPVVQLPGSRPNPNAAGNGTGVRPAVNAGSVRVVNRIWLAIASLLFFPPFAIVAIVYASRVNGLARNGKLIAAQRSADRALAWAQCAILIGLILHLISAAVKIYTKIAQ